MPLSGELLVAADEILGLEPETQATLRRAVSTAYYALFHLLIEECCKNWIRPEQRIGLARQFEHGRMKDASRNTARKHVKDTTSASRDLRTVANTFIELYQKRHDADYNLSLHHSPIEVSFDLIDVENAFEAWERIRDEQIAHDYLFSLFFKERT